MFKKNIFESFVRKKISQEKAQEKDSDFKYIERETQEKIFNFQEEKEKLVEKMHELLKKADNGEEISFGEKDLISVGYEGGKYKTYGKKSGEITKGDIAIASLWGKNLKLNSEIDRKTKKEFILRETKRRIGELWDKQIISASKDTKETDRIQAYSGLEKSANADENRNYEKMSGGHLAEKMVNSFFTKIIENNPELPFVFEQADVYDDVENKIDFYFHIKKEYTRGIEVQSCEDENENCLKTDIGVQYTMNTSKEKQEQKANQIEKAKRGNENIDDLVLITFPIDQIKDALKEWDKNKKDRSDFSGPERFLPKDIKEKLFLTMLNNLPKELNIRAEEYWEKIKNQV